VLQFLQRSFTQTSPVMLYLLPALWLSSLVSGSAIQHPLVASSSKSSLVTKKPLVDSETLQSHIDSDRLLRRAKHLYKIAELGEAEYNHPTRVIGSEGMLLKLYDGYLLRRLVTDCLRPSCNDKLYYQDPRGSRRLLHDLESELQRCRRPCLRVPPCPR
jgi:hypothetical protein